jgi:stringent starvation protein B
MVMVHLDARRDGVDVPEQHRGHPALALNLSRAFRLDVFEVGPFSVMASLSFQGEVYRCVIPYGAIFSLTSKADGQSRIFADAVPPEVQILAADEDVEESAPPEPQEPVADDGAPARAAEASDSADNGPFLRLVD